MCAERLRNKQIKFFLTEEEKKLLQDKAKCCDMDVSEFLRNLIYKKELVINKLPVNEIRETQMQMDKTNFEVNKIGNNINQLMKVIHEQSDVYSKKQIEEIINNLNDVLDKYKSLCNVMFKILYENGE